MARNVSDRRKSLYMLGNVLSVVGFVTFFSVFVTGAMNFGDFSNFEADSRSSIFRGVLGMALIIVGGVVRTVGARGLAGSGAVLDPEQARKDLEPFSRQAGGMAKDFLDEADIDLGSKGADEAGAGQVVMLRCTSCQKLNEEDSKFCQECGKPI